jgi:hypothetical protein
MVSLEEIFPALAKGLYGITSPPDTHYNCIAWAVGDTERWWWPGANLEEEYWPDGLTREATVAAFQEAFTSLGYEVCEGEQFEPGFERIALFADPQGIPKHAARQLPNGHWTNKLGKWEDIEHALHDLTGTIYGSVVLVMKRPLTAANERR